MAATESYAGAGVTSPERTVWIVGDIAGGASGEHRYHRGDCYVLDQEPNRDRATKVMLRELPDAYGPCQLCAPGGRAAPARAGMPSRPAAAASERTLSGLRAGQVAWIEYLDTGQQIEVQLVESGHARGAGAVSVDSPLGRALVGKEEGATADLSLPNRASRQVRIKKVLSHAPD